MACDRPRSYLIASSPKSQYEDLNSSLASQVVDAKKNLLGVFKNLGGVRDTMDTGPSTSSKEIILSSAQILAQRSQIPLPDEMDDGANNDQVETSTFDVTMDTTTMCENLQIEKYQALIEDLRGQLIEEKRKFLRVEQEIREEVCKEFATHMADMEKRLTEARREGIEDAEEFADERIQLLLETVQKQKRKRPQTVDETTSFYSTTSHVGDVQVPGSSLETERKLLEEKEKEIFELKVELERLSKKTAAVGDDYKHQELIQALEAKNKECRDLDEMLCEAGETFKNNADEIRRLESYVSVMEQTLKKKDEDIAKLRQAEAELQKKNDFVRRLEGRIVELEEKFKDLPNNGLASAQMEKDLADTRRSLDETQIEVETLKNKLQNSEVENQRLKESSTPVGQMKTSGDVVVAVAGAGPTPDTPTSATDESMDGGFKCIELESKIFELEKSLDSINRENETLKQNVQQSEELLQKCHCADLETKLLELEISSETYKSANETLKNSLNYAEERMQKCQCNLFENKIVALEKSLDSISRENESLKQSVHMAEERTQKHVTLESNFESLKKSLESMTYSLFEKNTQISKLEEEKKVNEERFISLTADLEKQEKSHLETTNQLRFDLDATKVLLVEAKKSKLEAFEAVQAAEEECRRTKNSLVALESNLEIEKQNNRRIVEDSVNNEKLIDSYKNAMREQEEIQQNMENALKSRREEVEQLNNDIVELKNKLEKSENSCLLQQKEINRIKNDLELMKDVGDKRKNEQKELEMKILHLEAEIKSERQKFTEKETELTRNTSSEITAKIKRIEELTLENAALAVKVENLTKDLRTKNGFVNLLNGKMAEKEQTLNNLESEVNKIEKTHQEVLAGKERQLEAWKQQKEASIVENEKFKQIIKETEAEKEQLKLKLNERENELKAKEIEFTNIRSDFEKIKLPPVALSTAKRRKQASTSVEDEPNQIEVTPMISKKIAQQPRARVGNKSETPEPQESSLTRRKTSNADIKKHLNDDGDTSPSHSSVVSDASNRDTNATDVPIVKNAKKPRAQSKSKPKKTVAILTEENSPILIGSISVASTPLNEVLPIIIPPESGNRPSRRAKSTARNGIFAVTEYLRNSPNAGSTTSNEQEDNGDEQEAPKKRKRVYKSPAKVKLSTSPGMDAVPGTSSVLVSKARVSNVKKAKQKV